MTMFFSIFPFFYGPYEFYWKLCETSSSSPPGSIHPVAHVAPEICCSSWQRWHQDEEDDVQQLRALERWCFPVGCSLQSMEWFSWENLHRKPWVFTITYRVFLSIFPSSNSMIQPMPGSHGFLNLLLNKPWKVMEMFASYDYMTGWWF